MIDQVLPTISVVTPSFNQGDFIAETIESVLGQDYPALEYQVIDGGSTDTTREVLKYYGKRFYWISAPDNGQSSAINQGWQNACGEILAWLNSDDIYYPGALQEVARFFLEQPEVDILYGNCDYIDKKSQRLQSYPTQPFNFMKLVRSTINYIPQPAVFLRRKVLEQIGYLDESLHFVMDFDYWLRAGITSRVIWLPVRLAGLRIHNDAKSVSRLGQFAQELIKVYQRFFAQPELPDEFRTSKTEAMTNCYYRAADCAFWANQLPEARAYAWQSWRLTPLRLRWLWLYLALGKPGRAWAEQSNGNPYLIQPASSRI